MTSEDKCWADHYFSKSDSGFISISIISISLPMINDTRSIKVKTLYRMCENQMRKKDYFQRMGVLLAFLTFYSSQNMCALSFNR